METMQTIKAFIARLAGAPLASPRAAFGAAARDRRRDDGSGLYADRIGAPLSDRGSAPSKRTPQQTSTRTAEQASTRRQEQTTTRTSKQRDGDDGEAFARRYLERAGLTFVAANVRYRDSELDLVMREARRASATATLVFVEVRRRKGMSHGGAAVSVTREKRRRVIAAAAHYLVGLELRVLPACRFDVLTLDGDPGKGFCIEWIRDAFRDEG